MKKDKYITFRATEEVKERLETIAKEEDRSLSYIINRIITEKLNEERRDEAAN